MSFKFTKSNLNFDVYAVSSKPTAPGANNDIAIITPVPMPNWIMSPDKPSGRPRSDGDVWIQYSVSGNTFNALKNNSMMIATIKAWQYVDGAWTEVEAVSCQNGEWVDWWNGITYYDAGNEYVAQTGGWDVSPHGTRGGIARKNADNIEVGYTTNGAGGGAAVTHNPIDLTGKTQLIIRLSVAALDIRIGIAKTDITPYKGGSDINFTVYKTVYATSGVTEVSLPIDGNSIGSGYIAVQAWACMCNIYKVDVI